MMRGRRAGHEADPAPSLKLICCQYFALCFRLSAGCETFHGLFSECHFGGQVLRIASSSTALNHSSTRSTKTLSSLGFKPSGRLAARCLTRYQGSMSCTVVLKACAMRMNKPAGPAKRRKRLSLDNRLSGRPVHVAGYQRADDRGAVLGGLGKRLAGLVKRKWYNSDGGIELSHA
jgi:hypothetical protein